MIRTFVGIEVPRKVKNYLIPRISVLRSLDLDGKIQKLSSIHLTLYFLGDIQKVQVPSIGDLLYRCTRDIKPFNLRIEGLSGFPSNSHVRVIFAGIAKCRVLIKLRNLFKEELSSLGFVDELREFRPHLTLMRLRSSRNLNMLSNYLKNLSAQIPDVPFRVQNIHLYQSQLCRDGSCYRKLITVKLADMNNGRTPLD